MKAMIALAATSLFALAAPAVAAPTITSFDFTGTCTNCRADGTNSTATAKLVVQDYKPGGTLSFENFVSFNYKSERNTFESSDFFPIFNDLGGSIGEKPGPYDVNYNESLFIFPGASFSSSKTGEWSFSPAPLFELAARTPFNVATIDPVDRGINGVWSVSTGAVPEPATWAMMIGGIGFAGAAMRRRAKPTVRVTYA